MPRNENEEVITKHILLTFDTTEARWEDDCTHRPLFSLIDDHVCAPCRCGDDMCPGTRVEEYCQPSFVVGMSVTFADDDNQEYDEIGLPLNENPDPLLPWDELILNG